MPNVPTGEVDTLAHHVHAEEALLLFQALPDARDGQRHLAALRIGVLAESQDSTTEEDISPPL
jgi:hypothetical protein